MTTDTRPTVLILGAQGRFGAAATEAFARTGWRVVAQARRPFAALPPGAEPLVCGLEEPARIVAAAAGARLLVHAINPLYTDWARHALPLARQGMDLAQTLGARFVLPGNVYNYGSRLPARLTELTPQVPDTPKGRLRLQLETELHQRPGLRSLVLRASDFYGAGAGSWLDLLVARDIARGRLVYPGPHDVAHAWAYLPDLCAALVALAERDRIEALEDHASVHFAGHTLTGDELLAHLQAAAADLGLRPARGWRIGSLPWTLLRVGGLVVPMWHDLAEMSYLWRQPHALDGTRLASLIGRVPHTAPQAALRDSLRALGHGQALPGVLPTATA